MSSRFAVSRETHVQALLSRLIPSVAGVAPEDEMGNFDLALDWAVGNFAVHQFLDTDCAVVQRDYARMCEKLRVHSHLESADVLRGLVDEFVSSRELSSGGSWRFPTAEVLDLPHVILSLLLNLSESPTQCVHRPIGLNQLRQRQTLEADDIVSDADDSSEDESIDTDRQPCDGTDSLSDWSEDDLGSDMGEVVESAGVTHARCTKQRSEMAIAWYDRSNRNLVVNQKSRPPQMSEHLILSACYASRSRRRGVASTACDLAGAVEYHHTKRQAYISPWPYSTTTELTLVREILMLFLGETGNIFHRVDEDSGAQTFQMIPVQVLHLSPDALRALVEPLICTANRLLRIRQFCSQHLSAGVKNANDRTTCATVQAFASAVTQTLDESLAWVREVEHRLLSETCSKARATDGSLLRLSRNARSLATTVGGIARIITTAMPFALEAGNNTSAKHKLSPAEMATCLLDTLYVSMCEDDGLATNFTRAAQSSVSSSKFIGFSLPSQLLLETIRPQVMILGSWIQDGRLRDVHGECFIRSCEAKSDPRAASFWTRAYTLRSGCGESSAGQAESSSVGADDLSCVPLLFKSVALEILAGGKSSIVCAEDGVLEMPTGAPQEVDNLYRSCQSDFAEKLEKLSAGVAQAAYARSVTSPILWKDCLASTIQSKCAKQTKRLAKRLVVQHRLEAYLDVLHACFLMGDGHFTSEVCRYCFRKLDRGETWDDQRVLVALFDDVLQRHGLSAWQRQREQQYDCGVSVEVERKPSHAGTFDIYSLDELFIGFKTPWPVSIIVNDECISRYNRIFRLLLQVKRAKHALDSLFVHRGLDSSEGASTQASLLFQAELMHFINNLHYYLMNRLAFGEWTSFKTEVRCATDMDTIAALYWRYLSVVHDQCLLSPKAKYVMDAILKILDIVLETQETVQQRRRHHEALEHERDDDAERDTSYTKFHLELERQCSRFRRLHKLLLQVLDTVVSQGSDTSHFEDLAMRLDFNGFYARGH